jgi:hypothetical protein
MVAQLLEVVRLMSRAVIPSVLARNRTILVAVVLAAGVSIAWRITPSIFDLNDAYISLHSARSCAISIAVAVPFLAWVRVDTGAWIPQTMQAKAAWFAEACNPSPSKLSVATEAIRRLFGPDQLLVFIVAIIPLVRSRLGRIGLLSCVTTLLVYATVFPGARFHNYYRYT